MVYAVTSGHYSDYVVEAVFSTLERAEAHMSLRAQYQLTDQDEILAWELDPEFGPVHTVVGMWENDPRSYTRVSVDAQPGVCCFYGGLGFHVVVQGDDEVGAIRRANEIRTELLALGLWGDLERAQEMFGKGVG